MFDSQSIFSHGDTHGRIERPDGWYHVATRGNERKAIFRSERQLGRCVAFPSQRCTVPEHCLEQRMKSLNFYHQKGKDGGIRHGSGNQRGTRPGAI